MFTVHGTKPVTLLLNDCGAATFGANVVVILPSDSGFIIHIFPKFLRIPAQQYTETHSRFHKIQTSEKI